LHIAHFEGAKIMVLGEVENIILRRWKNILRLALEESQPA